MLFIHSLALVVGLINMLNLFNNALDTHYNLEIERSMADKPIVDE